MSEIFLLAENALDCLECLECLKCAKVLEMPRAKRTIGI